MKYPLFQTSSRSQQLFDEVERLRKENVDMQSVIVDWENVCTKLSERLADAQAAKGSPGIGAEDEDLDKDAVIQRLKKHLEQWTNSYNGLLTHFNMVKDQNKDLLQKVQQVCARCVFRSVHFSFPAG